MSPVPEALARALGFYVYRLVDPRDGRTFYVGKGYGGRALQHARDALEAAAQPSDRLDRIRAIRAAGQDVTVVVHRHGMDEATALEVEAALIGAYPDLTNLVSGHGAAFGPASLEELLARYAAPDAVVPVPAILIKIEREWRPLLTPEQLYERTRRYWKCNPERRRPRPTHALAVARGIVREVYRIEAWETYRALPADRDDTRVVRTYDEWPSDHVRRGFLGAPDPAFAGLVGSSVRHLSRAGTQNPIAYVNC